jgi:hypothetical protein
MAKSKSQQANTARLKRMHAKAKAYCKAHPNAKYSTGLKHAGVSERGKTVSGKKKSKPAKKRVGERYCVNHEVTRVGKKKRVGGITYKGGTVKVGARTVRQKATDIHKQLEEKLAWKLLAVSSARNVTERKRASKEAASLKTQLKAADKLRGK